MYEIEIKAWVRNRAHVTESLNSFAEYFCSLKKEDTYYKFPVEKDGKKVSFRIRDEKILKDGKETQEFLFTYKKKEIKNLGENKQIEVNSENEFTLSDPDPLIMLSKDLGAQIKLKKTKITECWHVQTEYGVANVELCTIPPLGDFLEIEVVTDKNDPESIKKIREIEENIFIKCGISLDDVENRYYSDLLKEVSGT